MLEEYLPLARAISTEKAKSELLVIPILVEIRKILSRKISLFSESLFNVDISLGLTGYVDFLITLSEEMYAISSPVVTLVEAKNDLITSGIGQCVAQMVAAQIFNKKQDNDVSTIYGVVTTGTAWLFLKLEQIFKISISQLPASSEPEKPGIKELLEQLKTAIESESNLSDDDKVTALEEVETLAEAGQKPEEGAMQKQAKRAILTLKGLVSSLPAAAKLVESVQKLVPMISHIFGF
ncbi:MAG: hypothetical protein AAF630_07240 [Cyanobacteria bacterium P01_C01_bin.38]